MSPTGFQVGDAILGRYELVEVIGEGGFGVVYRGRQRDLGRTVAVKVLTLTDEASQARFELEARIISRITHPAVPSVFDYGSSHDQHFMVLEYVDGRDAREILDRMGPFSPGQVLQFLNQALGALTEAHAIGVLHRDMKPSNVMVTDTARGEEFKLLDFGIAKVLDTSTLAPEKRLTADGKLVGTPRYMAPEYFRTGEATPGGDLYAVGLVALEMLTGDRVYADLRGMDIARAVLSPEPVPLPFGSDVPDELRQCIEQLVQKDPDARPGSAREARQLIHAVEETSGANPAAPTSGRPIGEIDDDVLRSTGRSATDEQRSPVQRLARPTSVNTPQRVRPPSDNPSVGELLELKSVRFLIAMAVIGGLYAIGGWDVRASRAEGHPLQCEFGQRSVLVQRHLMVFGSPVLALTKDQQCEWP